MTAVVDASVILAAMLGEAGGEVLDLPGQLFHWSVVNLGGVHTKVVERGGTVEDVRAYLLPMPIRLRTFREAHAEEVGRLRPLTKHLGLSFGDRACLALGQRTRLLILTAEHRRAELDLGLDIRLIR